MKYTNGIEEIDVTKGAYESIYKSLGYIPVEAAEKEDNIDKMNVEELKALAEKREIEGFEKMKKAELIDALKV